MLEWVGEYRGGRRLLMASWGRSLGSLVGSWWWWAAVEQLLLNIFCLGKAALFTPLVRESKLLLGLFFFSANWHFWVADSSTPNAGYMRQTESPKNSPLCHSLGPELVCLLSTFQSLTFYIKMFRVFSLYIVELIGENMSAPSSWKWKSPDLCFLYI